MTDTSPTIATRIVDALFDQWEADHGLSKSKAIHRVQEILSAHTTQLRPIYPANSPLKPPCDEEQSPYTVGPRIALYEAQRQKIEQMELERQQRIVRKYLDEFNSLAYTANPPRLFGQLQIDPPAINADQKSG